ncbi:hypothetical protein [Halapricum desulfuricans]|uniref:hypothetical protein n=1 Tax=Halapricum desulfuricans TaxID=2841257 RepID=UPI001E3C6BDB|nr:hypothetical protein [Halapricum desulfuricans]
MIELIDKDVGDVFKVIEEGGIGGGSDHSPVTAELLTSGSKYKFPLDDQYSEHYPPFSVNNGRALCYYNYVDSMVLYDVSDPENVTLASEIPIPQKDDTGGSVITESGFVITADSNWELWDASDPYNPTKITDAATTGQNNLWSDNNYEQSIAVVGDIVYATQSEKTNVVDVGSADPANPSQKIKTSEIWHKDDGEYKSQNGIAYDPEKQHLYVSSGQYYLYWTALDVGADPFDPPRLGKVGAPPTRAFQYTYTGGSGFDTSTNTYWYWTEDENYYFIEGAEIIIDEPTGAVGSDHDPVTAEGVTAQERGRLNFPENIKFESYTGDAHANGGSLVTVVKNTTDSDDYRLLLWDVSNPDNPILANEWLNVTYSQLYPVITESGNTLIYRSSGTWHIYDISDPYNPTEVYSGNMAPADKTLEAGGAIGEVVVYLEYTHMYVFDLTNPSSPSVEEYELSRFPNRDNSWDEIYVDVKNKHIYVGIDYYYDEKLAFDFSGDGKTPVPIGVYKSVPRETVWNGDYGAYDHSTKTWWNLINKWQNETNVYKANVGYTLTFGRPTGSGGNDNQVTGENFNFVQKGTVSVPAPPSADVSLRDPAFSDRSDPDGVSWYYTMTANNGYAVIRSFGHEYTSSNARNTHTAYYLVDLKTGSTHLIQERDTNFEGFHITSDGYCYGLRFGDDSSTDKYSSWDISDPNNITLIDDLVDLGTSKASADTYGHTVVSVTDDHAVGGYAMSLWSFDVSDRLNPVMRYAESYIQPHGVTGDAGWYRVFVDTKNKESYVETDADYWPRHPPYYVFDVSDPGNITLSGTASVPPASATLPQNGESLVVDEITSTALAGYGYWDEPAPAGWREMLLYDVVF